MKLSDRLEALRDEAILLKAVAADIGRYSRERLQLYWRARPADVGDPIVEVFDRVLAEGEARLIAAKKRVTVSIADEKRLLKQLEQESANAEEWERRAKLAALANDEPLVSEAQGRSSEHLALAATLRESWEQQRAAVDELKQQLRTTHEMLLRGRRDRDRIVARSQISASRKLAETELADLEKTLRLLLRLGELS